MPFCYSQNGPSGPHGKISAGQSSTHEWPRLAQCWRSFPPQQGNAGSAQGTRQRCSPSTGDWCPGITNVLRQVSCFPRPSFEPPDRCDGRRMRVAVRDAIAEANDTFHCDEAADGPVRRLEAAAGNGAQTA